ncbi:hypothetical protein OLK001_19680 [Synechocystis sp. LKSZ1]
MPLFVKLGEGTKPASVTNVAIPETRLELLVALPTKLGTVHVATEELELLEDEELEELELLEEETLEELELDVTELELEPEATELEDELDATELELELEELVGAATATTEASKLVLLKATVLPI